MSIDLLIFDCDGVLVDSELMAIRADFEELAIEGITSFSLGGLIQEFTGVPQGEMLAAIERRTGKTVSAGFSERVERRVEHEMRSSLRSMPGVTEILPNLKTAKCVASSSDPKKLDLALSTTGIKQYFAPHIFSASQVGRGKPAPDLFLHASKVMSTDPKRCCVIEDSVAGVTAGVAAGMQVIGFVGGSHCSIGHSRKLEKLGARLIVGNWEELPTALEMMASSSV